MNTKDFSQISLSNNRNKDLHLSTINYENHEILKKFKFSQSPFQLTKNVAQ